MSEEAKKVWVVTTNVHAVQLERELNELAGEGYQVHSLHQYVDEAVPMYTVVAFDPLQLMKKAQDGLSDTLSAMMKGFPGG